MSKHFILITNELLDFIIFDEFKLDASTNEVIKIKRKVRLTQ